MAIITTGGVAEISKVEVYESDLGGHRVLLHTAKGAVSFSLEELAAINGVVSAFFADVALPVSGHPEDADA